MVEVRNFIYPKYDENIEKELKSNGITHLFSYGPTKLNNIRVIGKGKTGIVALIDDKKVIKIRRSDSPKESLELEAKFQEKACPSSPKIYSYGRNFIIMEYIQNSRILTRNDTSYLCDLLKRAKYLEEVKIQHEEISRPWKNVIVDDKRTYIIDYDSASFKENPFNVNKILSAFGYTNLAIKYKKRSIEFEEILNLLCRNSLPL
ncbi:serine/threonine protein kinase [Acidianus sulfidivorans JP7]|uniref:Serine/threonine protein kinase n=1 Tax=Acidianus sulfidivorans JP7 TaxID=619593 RepID=A0A2U9INW4_9CREN|nr:serine/threonine protein kinase [Acidianus sulfidivorans]AWR97677.1 serine/threonine protein kinase [Acidianus sulfidivorans JP7]